MSGQKIRIICLMKKLLNFTSVSREGKKLQAHERNLSIFQLPCELVTLPVAFPVVVEDVFYYGAVSFQSRACTVSARYDCEPDERGKNHDAAVRREDICNILIDRMTDIRGEFFPKEDLIFLVFIIFFFFRSR